MRTHPIIAAVTASLSCALCVASCVQGTEAAQRTEDIARTDTDVSADEAESLGEVQEPIGHFAIIRCKSAEYGIPCMVRCAEAGISCASGLPHPKKADGGDGDLFECRAAFGGQSCWYYYESSGDICVFFAKSVGWVPPWCRYAGGRP